ncbi:MAG TPA: alpha/beta hydrolase [Actinophytocola sp.]|uniref:alpha/beta hydrolase n=1 Tax=Actinophytocola sp. TaxID=1872138 RepID=UPI002DB93B9E|nr:alpha/beta hydrolase [Actinophytocola sp.]HEU5471782.1 alpha/beta hydrolase [Actinophytocola sp.]
MSAAQARQGMSRPDRITFASEDVTLVGELRLPAGPRPVPGVVLTGPFTGVKDQVVATYAAGLTEAGFATLAFDHRGFGESEGRRGHEDSQGKLADLRAAVDVLASRPEIDPERIGMVGICLGGGYAVRAGATDPRIGAVAGIAGAYNSPSWFAERMGIETYRAALRSFVDRYDEYLPAVAPDNAEAAMAGDEPFAYYGTERGNSAHWENRVTRGSLHSLMTFDALGAAPLLAATALLVVHGRIDAFCAPELATELHNRAAGPKQIVWLDCTQHIDLYDADPHVTAATAATAQFLHRHLSPRPR